MGAPGRGRKVEDDSPVSSRALGVGRKFTGESAPGSAGGTDSPGR